MEMFSSHTYIPACLSTLLLHNRTGTMIYSLDFSYETNMVLRLTLSGTATSSPLRILRNTVSLDTGIQYL